MKRCPRCDKTKKLIGQSEYYGWICEVCFFELVDEERGGTGDE
ncbi:hypothetical protein M5X06_32190 [Paenibacillus alvei]|uniref:Uncharacterized protein n=1 Tax=Paenibacillus alvei TaxID=44250 RepID=A0ABT4H7Z3_PAEAL|nr:zinc finger domain-containing protein [Paenibacillus alvei]MCY9765094.1 hypothetical protein [Paenibacillus alvei]MCY9771437.1 hypothetical protein [Paenibacillus alvei]